MLRLMIVDDEQIIREALSSMIDYTCLLYTSSFSVEFLLKMVIRFGDLHGSYRLSVTIYHLLYGFENSFDPISNSVHNTLSSDFYLKTRKAGRTGTVSPPDSFSP